ncbi:TetR/AcrR family transcriptional regulator [Enterococcus sp. AZ109]|uniref:TetR/AcrR family transcriptional regulator n=1 Tax=Enterococcus sp. AZ109 TaxID=2774634 RepID=UPI003F28EF2A
MDSKDKIKEALTTLLAKQCMDEIRVYEIAAAAGVSRVTFYKHFPDKEAVLEQLVNDFGSDLDGILYSNIKALNQIDFSDSTEIKNGLAPHAFEIVSFLYNEKKLIQTLMLSTSDIDILKITYDKFYQYFKLWLPPKFQINYDPKTFKQYLDFLTRGTALLLGTWFRKDFKQSPQEITDIILNVLSPSLYNIYHRAYRA